MNHRIIPRLDIKGPNLVKGIHLEGLRVLGNPEIFAKHYYEKGADEIMYVDVVASLYDRNSLNDLISKTAQEIFIPLTVGGGLRTLKDIRSVLRAGADKVSLNTAAIKNPNILKEASKEFGSSTIIATIEALSDTHGNYYAFTDNGRENTNVDVFKWAAEVENLGVGELLITSIDREGTGAGYDLELIKKISEIVSIPVIAHGGGGTKTHVKDVFKKGNADAVAISSLFHYEYIKYVDMTLNTSEGNKEFLNKKRSFSKFETIEIEDLKTYLADYEIVCKNKLRGSKLENSID